MGLPATACLKRCRGKVLEFNCNYDYIFIMQTVIDGVLLKIILIRKGDNTWLQNATGSWKSAETLLYTLCFSPILSIQL